MNQIKIRNFRRTKFNLVRFNPPIDSDMKEVNETRLHELFDIVKASMDDKSLHKKSTIISRVGYEAYASCGMFPNDDIV